MATALLEGIILGITLAFLIGPGFIALVNTSLQRGFISGVQFAAGIAFSDVVLIALSYLGALQFLSGSDHQVSIGIIGGMVLIGFGMYTFFQKFTMQKPVKIEIKLQTERFFRFFFKGFFLNLLNPFLLIFWIGIMSLVSAKYGIPSREINLFFAGTIGAVFVTDALKSFVAHRIKRLLNMKVLTIINRIVGLLLMAFGVLLIFRVAFLL